jgi:hypothetical protein
MQRADDLHKFGRWRKLATPLAEVLANRRPGTYRHEDGRPVLWACSSTEKTLTKRHGRPSKRRDSRYGIYLLWQVLDGATRMPCGWKAAYCGPDGCLVWGDCLNVLGVN